MKHYRIDLNENIGYSFVIPIVLKGSMIVTGYKIIKLMFIIILEGLAVGQ